MANAQPYHIKTITEYHRITGLPKPEHPLISVVNFEDITPPGGNAPMGIVFDFYSISLKRNFNAKVKSCSLFLQGRNFLLNLKVIINLRGGCY
jgi:AraC family transcriptional activator of pobA